MSNNIAVTSRIEFLPNEILLNIFSYLSSSHLYTSFHLLNRRFTSILHEINVKCKVKNDNSLDIKYAYFFASSTICLSLYECKYIDLTRFSCIQSLILYNPGRELVQKIRPEFFQHLKELIINGGHRAITQWWTPLHNNVFSNGFPNLYKVCLTSVSLPSTMTKWTGSLSIRELEICWFNRSRFLPALFFACPNLYKLKLIIDQFYSTETLEYTTDALLSIDENTIPQNSILHNNLLYLEVECVISVGRLEFLESLLKCFPDLKQLRITIYPLQNYSISCDEIGRLLRTYTPKLNYFYCQLPLHHVFAYALDETFHESIQRIHPLFINVDSQDRIYLIISST